MQAPTHFFLHTVKSINIIAQRAGLIVTETVHDAVVSQLIAGESKRRRIVPAPGKRFRDYFTKEEIANIVEMGCLNALFVVGRSIGIFGHVFDQKRLKQPLYRTPYDEIAYMTDL